ncbi:MAG: sigma-70 family RNA polymerase sigma factor [bacterium]|nr:sigma-70 family RNA polymerase sigma factor [bacterium]
MQEPGQAENPHDATVLLARVGAGDSAAAHELLPLVYEQLRAMAGSYFRGQPSDHTLQPTALVHEAYLKLVHVPDGNWEDRMHFCAVAATAMRQILHDRARRRRAAKRGGDAKRVPLEQMETPSGGHPVDMVALDDALERLAALDERQARIVELRFFGGLTVEQVAHVLEVSSRTIEKEWRRVRAWLSRELSGGGSS